jgi:hypothetical protein
MCDLYSKRNTQYVVESDAYACSVVMRWLAQSAQCRVLSLVLPFCEEKVKEIEPY